MDSEDKGEVTYLINDVSRRVALSQKRIREYEKGGLIKPAREPRTNNRRYSEADINQIQRIKELIHAHGFTVACLRFFLASAPCWVIFNCNGKEVCASYSDFRIPCYEVAKHATHHSGIKDCESCPIYLNRDVKTMPLLLKP
ncbi:MerR family transcriptional regulator [Desulfosarcina sp.]|uniref:helix-turn-helix domain-containing protein n=1 Tax=Desulfosarcina sp. TaxID=2027861 RepID=UPI0039708D53